MSLSYAILTLLVGSPHTGYDLAKKFVGSVGFFWRATHQQIYRELSKLEEWRWVGSEVIPQENRPDKKLYSITDLGKQKLINWLVEPSEPMPIKEELLVKLSVGYLVPDVVMQKELERHRQLHLEQLAIYRELEKRYFQNFQDLPIGMKYSYLTLQRGIHFESGYIAWCDEALQLLNQFTPIDEN